MNEELMAAMRQFSSAEEFLNYFGVAYDQKVVNISRLHILKRFNQYLAREGGVAGFADLGETAAVAKCRELLSRAYADFVHSSGVEQKVFKVFHQGEQSVSIDSLRSSLR